MGALIGAALSAFTAWIAAALPGIVGRILAVLGIGFVSFSGMSVVTADLAAYFSARMGDFPANMLQILNLAGFGTGVNMLVAGVTTFFTIKLAVGAFSAFRPSAGSFRG